MKNLKLIILTSVLLFIGLSLFASNIEKFIDRQETVVLSSNSFYPKQASSLRVVLFDHETSGALSNSNIRISIKEKGSWQSKVMFEGKTDETGTSDIKFETPEEEGDYELIIETTSYVGKDVIVKPIKIERDYKILLSTDKPLYQPQQTMLIRALALQTYDLHAAGNKQLLIEVEDPKGNKLFKKSVTANEYGIASANFTLAEEINLGRYTVRAKIGDTTSEVKVGVERYVLPKFKIELSTDKKFYLPGEAVSGVIDANYFFGKPVKDAVVNIKVQTFDVKLTDITNIQGKTDDSGTFDFQFELPAYFVGQPLEKGKGILIFNITVTDTTGHEEKISSSKTVAKDPIFIEMIPESGSLVNDLENIIYVATSYPDGTPVKTTLDINGQTIETNEFGFASFKIIPRGYSYITIAASDDKGNTATKKEHLHAGYGTETILVRTDKAMYSVGETVHLAIFSSKEGTVYVDVIKDKQTVLTKAVDTKNKQADMVIDLTQDMFGTLEIHAYKILSTGEIQRDVKTIVVDIAKDVPVVVSLDKETHLPGEEAAISFDTGQQSAIGINIVDESVFALQEMEPGFEKIYFLLESEIMKPRYEIETHIPEIFYNYTTGDEEIIETRDDVVRAVLASSAPMAFGIRENSYQAKQQSAQKIKQTYFSSLVATDLNLVYILPFIMAGLLVARRIGLVKNIHLFKLGGLYFLILFTLPLAFILLFMFGGSNDLLNINFFLILAGLVTTFVSLIIYSRKNKWKMIAFILLFILMFVFIGGGLLAFTYMSGTFSARTMGIAPAPMGGLMQIAEETGIVRETKGAAPTAPAAEEGEKEPARIRQYFPETLYSNPSLITDENGKATLNLQMADSITTWRLSATASTREGKIGSATRGMLVFQDFFTDIDLPVALTQNDEISVPVAVYNYLTKNQSVRLVLVEDDWFDLLDTKEKRAVLSPNEAGVEYFRIRVKDIGTHRLTVFAYGSEMSDAISRSVRILPDGQEVMFSISDQLDRDVQKSIPIPEEAIDGASKIWMTIYPGYFSQVVEGLEKILRVPFGCFEQTSSITYPNVLVLNYMKSVNKITPEVQMKAEEYINLGYQRLLTFEISGGGFSIFGNPPAEKILSAYGLMEISDMSKVYPIDENVISRTQNWLLNQQEGDHWTPDGHYGGAYKARDSDFSATGYIVWAMLESGYDKDDSKMRSALDYIGENYRNAWDNSYALAVASLALTHAGRDSTEILNRLREVAIEENNTVYWTIDPSIDPHHRSMAEERTTWIGSRGQQADIETTALVALAFMRADYEPQMVNKALKYIVQRKDCFGTWGSTQATVLSMKALITSIGKVSEKADADIEVWINSQKVSTVKITKDNSDVLQLIDLGAYTTEGNNILEVKFSGEGNLFYQIVSRYYVPYRFIIEEIPEIQKLISIDLEYDKTTLQQNDIVRVNARVEYHGLQTVNWVIVDLGIPPGFSVLTEDLDALKSEGLIARYTLTGRQITIYLEKVEPNKPLEFSYRLQARYPIKAKTPQSSVYEYYNPEVKDIAKPIELNVI